jgi:hypothetical protein
MLEEELRRKEERLAEEKARKLAQEQRLLAGLRAQYVVIVALACLQVDNCLCFAQNWSRNFSEEPARIRSCGNVEGMEENERNAGCGS